MFFVLKFYKVFIQFIDVRTPGIRLEDRLALVSSATPATCTEDLTQAGGVPGKAPQMLKSDRNSKVMERVVGVKFLTSLGYEPPLI